MPPAALPQQRAALSDANDSTQLQTQGGRRRMAEMPLHPAPCQAGQQTGREPHASRTFVARQIGARHRSASVRQRLDVRRECVRARLHGRKHQHTAAAAGRPVAAMECRSGRSLRIHIDAACDAAGPMRSLARPWVLRAADQLISRHIGPSCAAASACSAVGRTAVGSSAQSTECERGAEIGRAMRRRIAEDGRRQASPRAATGRRRPCPASVPASGA